jgi:hypothetical protein
MITNKNVFNFTLCCLLISLVGCKSSTLYNVNELSPAEKGIYRAQEDVRNEKRQILYYGKPWSVGKPLIDDKTGLPVKIISGCDVTKEFREEIDAYNSFMRLHSKQNKK